MIDINLVPDNLRKKKQKATALAEKNLNIPKEMIIGLCGGLIALLLIVVVGLQVIIGTKYAEHKRLQKEWEDILPNKKGIDEITNKMRSLQGKIKAIDKITAEKGILWSKKLSEIANSLPRGVWLKRIAFDKDVLFVEGSAVSKGENEMINVHRFANNLKEKDKFMKNLQDLEVGSIQRRKIKSTEIADFTIKAKIK